MPIISAVAVIAALISAIAEIGVVTCRIRTDDAAALVTAGMISVFLFPAVALIPRTHRPATTVVRVAP